MADRPPIPAGLARRLLIEAGHRCALPTCRQIGPLQFEHIEDWARVKRHDFENMIVLCANCHGRKGSGPGQIDRKSLRQYKANLAVLNSRYSDLERRALEVFAAQRKTIARNSAEKSIELADGWMRGLAIELPGPMRLLMMYLVKDGIVELVPPGTTYVQVLGQSAKWVYAPSPSSGVIPTLDYYRLSQAGVEFLDAWLGAQPIETDPIDE